MLLAAPMGGAGMGRRWLRSGRYAAGRSRVPETATRSTGR